MATRFIDTGEAYLSADEKRFARVVDVPLQIASGGAGAGPSPIVTVLLALAVAGLAVLALMI
ncbi:MAG: hypothetical protein K1X35_14500 [Caulobacteraceae bacterium]|nr:hypothetical protein [Caulobacteraceae bacterium]